MPSASVQSLLLDNIACIQQKKAAARGPGSGEGGTTSLPREVFRA